MAKTEITLKLIGGIKFKKIIRDGKTKWYKKISNTGVPTNDWVLVDKPKEGANIIIKEEQNEIDKNVKLNRELYLQNQKANPDDTI